jgi:hypothetical protein
MISPYAFALLLAAPVWQAADAALYKWVDRAGQVTYSSDPPPAGTPAEKVQAPPQPSAEEIRQTEERLGKIEEQAEELAAQRRQQEAEAAEEARLRALQSPPPPVVIEKPVYVPQPVYYPPVMKPPPKKRQQDKDRPRRRPPAAP